MKPRRILVTGSEGFIGRAVVSRALMAGYEVAGLDSMPKRNDPQNAVMAHFQMLLPSRRISEPIIQLKPDVIIHCAGRASVPQSIADPATDFESSVTTTFELLEALRMHLPTSRFLLLSSAAVYGNPTSLPVREAAQMQPLSPYGFHKFMSEQCCLEYARIYGLHTIIARVFSTYGPGLKRQVVWDICRKAFSDNDMVLQGTGEESRDFIFSEDLAEALLCLIERSDQPGSIFNVASGEETLIRDIACHCLRLLGSEKRLSFDGNLPQGVPSRWRADITKLSEMGYRGTVPFLEGLERVVTWFKIKNSL